MIGRRRLGMFVMMLWSSAAFCEPSLEDLAAHRVAGQRLILQIQTAQKKHDASLLKTPETVRLIRVVSDAAHILRSGSYSPGDIQGLLETCYGAIMASVLLVGGDVNAQQTPSPAPHLKQAETVALMDHNAVLYQDELQQLQPFMVRCMAKVIPPLTAFASSLEPAALTDVRRQGVVMIRSGLLQVYPGIVQMMGDPRYSDDFKTALLEALAETSEPFASVMQLSERKQMHDSIAAVAASATGTHQTQLSRIAQALSADTCEGLCAIR